MKPKVHVLAVQWLSVEGHWITKVILKVSNQNLETWNYVTDIFSIFPFFGMFKVADSGDIARLTDTIQKNIGSPVDVL